MKPQVNLYLGLGSNMGDKFENLQLAVNSIFETIGSVQKISSVYESPSMGFQGASFLNCVLYVTTQFSAKKILKKISNIEKSLGRKAKVSKIYESRPIDIDILFYGEEIIESTYLTIPHPQLHNRNFVLQPLAEINSELNHPILNTTTSQLLAETKDKSSVQKQQKWLKNPLTKFNFSKYKYVAIEGNIGAGKTSLASLLAADFNAKIILERFKDNPFLPKFYEEPQRYAFPLEMSFLADRYQQLVDDINQFDLFKDCIVSDYDVYKSLIFAKVTLQEEEFNLYKKLFYMMHKELPKPDIYVYLFQNTDRLLQNIKQRGRKYEQSIQAEYLQKINNGYLEFIKTLPKERVKLIDISKIDFMNNREDYLNVLKFITA